MPYFPPASASGAPVDATYITQTANGTLSAEQNLAALATGLLKNTTTTGVLSIAAEGTDYFSPPFTDTNSLVKGSADPTKLLRFEVDGFTAGATRVMTPPNQDTTLAGQDFANVFTAVQQFNENVGFGNTPGTDQIRVRRFATEETGEAPRALRINLFAEPVLDSDANYYAIEAKVDTVGTPAFTSTVGAMSFTVRHAGTGNLFEVAGVAANVGLNGGGTADKVTGMKMMTSASAASVITEMLGGEIGQPSISGGATVAYNYGMLIRNQKVSGISNAYGIYLDPQSAGGYAIFTNAGIVQFGDRVEILQPSTTAAVPTLKLQQADLSEEFIRFEATVGAGNPINTTALGAYYGRVRVYVEGVGAKWLALYDS